MDALILVDLQNDFLPGGALAVPNGDEVIPVANRLMNHFDVVIATQDWHPASHGSFASQHKGCCPGDIVELDGTQQVLWPDHCIQETRGAEFSADLKLTDSVHVFRKGTDPTIDSYSGFFDNDHRKATGLGDALMAANVNRVFVLGLATDYCVKFTAMDAVRLGFEVTLIEDGCRGVNLQPGDVSHAIEEMKVAGVFLANSDALKRSMNERS